VLSVIKELSEEGWTMVIVTHELSFAREVADEVVFIDQGVVVERGAPAQVLGDPQQERTRLFVRRLLIRCRRLGSRRRRQPQWRRWRWRWRRQWQQQAPA
jgi:ABC-type glutathione transport system ATPase component